MAEAEMSQDNTVKSYHNTWKKPPVPYPAFSGSSGLDAESQVEFDPNFSVHCKSSKKSVSEDKERSEDQGMKQRKKYVCEQCGVAVAKPALLSQHMRSHSDEKPFACSVSGCSCTYKRQDHLNRHMQKHQGSVHFCSQPGCDQSFGLLSNLQRHLRDHREEPGCPQRACSREKYHVCSRPGCGKKFRYPSCLKMHEDNVHGRVGYVGLYCMYPGCGDKFQGDKALLMHAEIAHPYLLCEVCGETIERKSFMRHVRSHAVKEPKEIFCPYDGCGRCYTRDSNLKQHVRSVHLKLKPFICSVKGCGKCYAHKAARDRHELSGLHLPPRMDFEEQDQLQQSRGRGGRKRVTLERIVEDLYLKKVRMDDERGAEGRDVDERGDDCRRGHDGRGKDGRGDEGREEDGRGDEGRKDKGSGEDGRGDEGRKDEGSVEGGRGDEVREDEGRKDEMSRMVAERKDYV